MNEYCACQESSRLPLPVIGAPQPLGSSVPSGKASCTTANPKLGGKSTGIDAEPGTALVDEYVATCTANSSW